MLWRRVKRVTGTKHCEKLNEDVLRLIIEAVDTDRGLLSLARVSRQFHELTTPELYKDIGLNLSHRSHCRLIARLAQTDNQVPRLIQYLSIQDVGKASVRSALDLLVVLAKLTNLRAFTCEGSMNIPECVLETLRRQGSQNIHELNTRNLDLAPGLPQPIHAFMIFPACTRLTIFNFTAIDYQDVYDDFKVDVVCMMVHNPALKQLNIGGCISWGMKEFPEMVSVFKHCTLPRLTSLSLFTGTSTWFFTPWELAIWGMRGGFEELTNLEVQTVFVLTPFIGRTPRLETLNFNIDYDDELEILSEHLEAAASRFPFGPNLRSLRFQGVNYLHWYQPLQTLQMVPWCLLRIAPKLTTLNLHRPFLLSSTEASTLSTTPEDIRTIGEMCPELSQLRIDVGLPYSRTKVPSLPKDVLEALAQLKGPIKLGIYLHVLHPKSADFALNESIYYKLFNDMLDTRDRLGLPCDPPFEVGFTVVGAWVTDLDDYDCRLMWHQQSGKMVFERYTLKRLFTLEEDKEVVRKKYSKLRCAMHRTLHGDK